MPSGNPQPLLNTCPSCQEIIDVSGVRPYEKIHCPLCGDTIRVRTVFNHFTLKGEIGQGGMSRVFRAVDNTLGREVALKILHSRYEDQPQLAAQFEREAKITASITHPHVVQVYSAGHDQGYYYIAMELLPSKSLEHLIKEDGRIPEADALRIIQQVALGLSAAFQHGMIHRDVKPGNILLDHDGSAKLVDFGLALMQGAEEDPLADIWATPFYVPPEKLWGRPEDFRSDIYSLGATLYHMIAGRPPHSAETDSVQELITIKSQPLDLRAGAPHMREATLQLITRMMAYDPPARYGSYEELLAAIDAARRKAQPRASGHAFPLWAKIGTALLGTASIGILVLLGTGALKAPSAAQSPAVAQDSAPLIISAEDAALSQLLPRGREALISNNVQGAVTTFRELAGNDRARADWRTWAAFHLGMEGLFQGDLASSGTYFAQSARLSSSLDRELADFFPKVAQALKPELLPEPRQNSATPLAALFSLVLGLKSWAADDFPNARDHLSRYLEGTFEGGYAWASSYHPRAVAIRNDIELLTTLPKPPESGEVPILSEHVDRLAAIHKQLTQDRSKRLVASAISTAEKRIAELAEAARTAASKQALSADFALIRDQRKASLEKGALRQFGEAAAFWRSAAWQTSFGKHTATRHAEACESAAEFLDRFAAAFYPDHQYEGEILRTSGRPFTAKLVRFTPDTLTVDLGFGPTPLKMETISNEGIFKIARATVLQNAKAELLQSACFFAWFTGFEAEARQLALSFQSSTELQERWDAVTRPVPNP